MEERKFISLTSRTLSNGGGMGDLLSLMQIYEAEIGSLRVPKPGKLCQS
jgi:hypothetical protein